MAAATIDSGLVSALLDYIDEPQYFVEDILHIKKQESWQREALKAMGEGDRVAVRSGHGVGKTALESWVILWFMSTRPYPKVPCTAPTQRQLFDILWAEVAKWIDGVPEMRQIFTWHQTRIAHRDYPERWFATPRTSNKPENLQGFHEEHILFVVDEASGVADPIFEVIEGALTTDDAKLLMCGNPTKTSGVFYSAFHNNRWNYHPIKVGVLDVSTERVKPKYRENLVKQYGADSDVVRVRADGEFPKAEPDQLIPLEMVEQSFMREAYRDDTGKIRIPRTAPLEIGVDVARFGDDETVISARIGIKMCHIESHAKQGTMETTGYVVAAARQLGTEYVRDEIKIKIDDDGIGGAVVDRLREMQELQEIPGTWEIIDCHNGRAPIDKDKYENWGTESWHHMRDLLQEGEIELMDDDGLVGQLTTRHYKMTSRSRIVLERKEEMKKRGLRSPDRADSVVLAFADATLPEFAGHIRIQTYGDIIDKDPIWDSINSMI